MDSIWAGRKVRLRGIEPDDWRTFIRFDEHSAETRDVDSVHRLHDVANPPRSIQGYRHWAAHRAEEPATRDDFHLAIETLDGGILVGSMSTTQTDPRAGRFSYGIGIGREHQRCGYASDTIRILLAYMFGERRYHKCEVGIYGFNHASLALHRSLGFREEGRLHDHEFFAGGYHDLVLMGMTADEFARRHTYPRPWAHESHGTAPHGR